MSLKDFMQKLQEQDDSDVVYSPTPVDSIRVIPPTKTPQAHVEIQEEPVSLRVLPPEIKKEEPKSQPIILKLNIKPKIQEAAPVPRAEQQQYIEQKPVQTAIESVDKHLEKPPVQQIVKEKPHVKSKEELEEDLFRASGTGQAHREQWFELLHTAQSSRKQNSVVDRMKQGRFAITRDNQVLVLPDYDIRGKSSNDIFKDKWL